MMPSNSTTATRTVFSHLAADIVRSILIFPYHTRSGFKAGEKPSGAKAQQFIAQDRRHECLLHPLIVNIHADNALPTLTLEGPHIPVLAWMRLT
jgi:hypothetical protein